MNPDHAQQIVLGLTWFVVFLFSTTLHEASHALAGYRLGDPTAYHGGQVTLNPLPHIRREPMGMILVPLLTYVSRGWGRRGMLLVPRPPSAARGGMGGGARPPSAPAGARRNPRRAAVMALAG